MLHSMTTVCHSYASSRSKQEAREVEQFLKAHGLEAVTIADLENLNEVRVT